jgi:hypothetical protein
MIQRAHEDRVVAAAREKTEVARGESPGLIQGAFLALASQRTTSLLVIVLAAFVAIAAFVPQGREALELARDPGATVMHRLAAWGLTDVFDSAWMHALAALLVANLLAMALATMLREHTDNLLRAPAHAPLAAELKPEEPEHAALTLRELFRSGFGVPVNEDVEGSRVTMVFDTAPTGRLAPMATHIGLIVLVLGAAAIGRPVDSDRAIARAHLDVRDSSTGKVGNFDMVAGETFQFFRWPSKYSLRYYTPSYEGLGPAAQLSRADSEGRQEAFWVFLRAPAGFDKRHRNGEVEIVARWMGLVAPPGQGLASSRGAILLVVGLGLLSFGALSGRRPEGRLWLEADGDRVRIVGVPRAREDRGFARMFDRWKLLATAVIVEE